MGHETGFPDVFINVNGVRARCRQAGQGGPPVVLIHGLGDMAALSSFFTRVR
jgi:pimeloyl-ACP methyl ester carboxylesterase